MAFIQQTRSGLCLSFSIQVSVAFSVLQRPLKVVESFHLGFSEIGLTRGLYRTLLLVAFDG